MSTEQRAFWEGSTETQQGASLKGFSVKSALLLASKIKAVNTQNNIAVLESLVLPGLKINV